MFARTIVALFPVVFLNFSAQSASTSHENQSIIQNRLYAEAVFSVVENALWAADGTAADKAVYVIYSSDCGWSQKLFAESRALTDKVQFRWIPAAGRNAAQAASSRSVDAVAASFTAAPVHGKNHAFEQRAMKYNSSVKDFAFNYLNRSGVQHSFGYPTLIYRTDKGIKAFSGMPANMEQLWQEVISQPENSALHPNGASIIENEIITTKVPRLRNYVNRNDDSVAVYAFPDSASPQVHTLGKGYQLPVSGVTEDLQWIEVLPWGHNQGTAYIADPLTARLATLDFLVQRARGVIVADRVDLDIHSHPDKNSPILDVLPRGYQLNKTGEVSLNGKVWDEIQLFTDGTKGYIAR